MEGILLNAFTVEHSGKGGRWSLAAADKESADGWCDAISLYALRFNKTSTEDNKNSLPEPLHFDALKRSLWTQQWRPRHFILCDTVLTYYEKSEIDNSMKQNQRGQFIVTSADVSSTTTTEMELQLQTCAGEPVRLKMDIQLASKILNQMLLPALQLVQELRWTRYDLVNATQSDDWCLAFQKRREGSCVLISSPTAKESKEMHQRIYPRPHLLFFGGTNASELPAVVRASDNVDSALHKSPSHQQLALKKTTQLLHLGMPVKTRGGVTDTAQQELQQQNISSSADSSSWLGVNISGLTQIRKDTTRKHASAIPTDGALYSLPVGSSSIGTKLTVYPYMEGEAVLTPRARRGHVLIVVNVGKNDKSIYLHGGVALNEDTGDTLLSATSAYRGAGAGQGQSLCVVKAASRVLADCWCIQNISTSERLQWSIVRTSDVSDGVGVLPPRHHHAISAIRNGLEDNEVFILSGGMDEEGNVRSEVLQIHPQNEADVKITVLPSLLFARASHGAVTLGCPHETDQLLVVVGGISDGNGRRHGVKISKASVPIIDVSHDESTEPLPLLEAFLPQTGCWMTPVTFGADLPEGLSISPAVTRDEESGMGYVLLFGHPVRTHEQHTRKPSKFRQNYGIQGNALLFRLSLNRSTICAPNDAPIICAVFIDTQGSIPRPVGGLQMCAVRDAFGSLWLYLFGALATCKSETAEKKAVVQPVQEPQTSGWGILSQVGKIVTKGVIQAAKTATATVRQPVQTFPIALRILLPISMESVAREQITNEDDFF